MIQWPKPEPRATVDARIAAYRAAKLRYEKERREKWAPWIAASYIVMTSFALWLAFYFAIVKDMM